MTGTLLLTFDDHHPAEWAAHAQPLLAAHGARATFFLDRPDLLDDAERAALRRLAAAGHSIGAHTRRHRRAPEQLAAHGPFAYLAEEITPCTEALTAIGVVPRSFAYPYNDRDARTDRLLGTLFTRLRAGAADSGRGGGPVSDDAFVPAGELAGRTVLPGVGIDTGRAGAPHPDNRAAVDAALRRAADEDLTLTCYAHAVADTHAYANHLAPARLAELLALATALGLQVVGFDDLPARSG